MNLWELLLNWTEEPEPIDTAPQATTDIDNETAEGQPGEETEMRIGTHNIRNFPDMPREKVRASASVIASITDIAGLQEIQEPQDKQDIAKAMNGFDFVALDRRPPIAYRTEKLRLSPKGPRGFIRVSDPVPGFMPELGFTVATFQSVLRPGLAPFIVVNVHYPPGAFNPHVTDRKAWRIRTWNTYHAMIEDFTNKWNARGFTIFYVGDFNRQYPKTWHKNMRWLHGGTIDRIGIVVGSVGIDVKQRYTKQSPSDHDAYAVRGKLVNRKRVK